MTINSKRKGKTGELEVVKVLKTAGFDARRGQQFKGSDDSPDVVCDDLADFHIEVKRTEKTALYDWLKQAMEDAPNRSPLVIHRKNDQPWLAILKLEDFLSLVFRSMSK